MQSISKQIEVFLLENKTATEVEVRAEFKNISRQLVSKVFHKLFTAEELKARRDANLQTKSTQLFELIKEGKTLHEIAAITKLSPKKLQLLIEGNQEITDFLNKEKEDVTTRVSRISIDWVNGMGVAELAAKYDLGTSAFASTFISKLRTKYGTELFPNRIKNQTNLNDKIAQYHEMKAKGINLDEIAIKLGYKNKASMRSAMAQIKKEAENGIPDIEP